jgi:hypothetical protein
MLKTLQTWGAIIIGIILSLLSWSLKANVDEFKAQMNSVGADVARATAAVNQQNTDIAVMRNEVSNVKVRVEGLEDRERIEHGPGGPIGRR